MAQLTRRHVIGGVAGMAALQGTRAFAQGAPAGPVALNIIDVAGNLQLTQTSIERFAQANPR